MKSKAVYILLLASVVALAIFVFWDIIKEAGDPWWVGPIIASVVGLSAIGLFAWVIDYFKKN